MNKLKFDVIFKCSDNGDSSVARFSADPIVTSFPFLNGNNFLFTKECLEKQAATMAHRPLNFMHNEKDIIGHCVRCTPTNNLPAHVLEAGCGGLKVSGVFYKMLNKDLYDQIVEAGDAGFKVSMEAISTKVEWVLYDGEERSLLDTEKFDIIRPEQDPELHAIGRLYLWMFGTVRGLQYNGRNVAVLLGGQEGDLEFVGLALTDERMGPAAADQNTRFNFASLAMSHGDFSMSDFAEAIISMDESKLSAIGISMEDAVSINEKFESDMGEKLSEDGTIEAECVGETVEMFQANNPGIPGAIRFDYKYNPELNTAIGCLGANPFCVVPGMLSESNGVAGQWSISTQNKSNDIVDMISSIQASVSESEVAIKAIASLAQRSIDERDVEIQSLNAKVSTIESENANRLEVARVEFSTMAKQMEGNISRLEEEVDLARREIGKLRIFELVSMGASIEWCKSQDLYGMSTEDYSRLKKTSNFSVMPKEEDVPVVDFKSQIKRICAK